MIIEFIVNNYTLGARVKSTPKQKITKIERLDSKHTCIRYNDINDREKQFIEKVLAKQGTIIEA